VLIPLTYTKKANSRPVGGEFLTTSFTWLDGIPLNKDQATYINSYLESNSMRIKDSHWGLSWLIPTAPLSFVNIK